METYIIFGVGLVVQFLGNYWLTTKKLESNSKDIGFIQKELESFKNMQLNERIVRLEAHFEQNKMFLTEIKDDIKEIKTDLKNKN